MMVPAFQVRDEAHIAAYKESNQRTIRTVPIIPNISNLLSTQLEIFRSPDVLVSDMSVYPVQWGRRDAIFSRLQLRVGSSQGGPNHSASSPLLRPHGDFPATSASG